MRLPLTRITVAWLPAVLAFSGGAVLAQSPTKPASAVTLPSGQSPDELLGATCKDQPLPSPDVDVRILRICMGDPPTRKPSVTLMAIENVGAIARDKQIESNRDALKQRKIVYAVEEDFSPVTMPGSVGVRAHYKTDVGDRYFWTVSHAGTIYTVVVFAFSDFDAKAAQTEVEAKIFGIGKQ